MKVHIKSPKTKKCSVSSILKSLGAIDKKVKTGRITEKQHDILSRKTLKRCFWVR